MTERGVAFQRATRADDERGVVLVWMVIVLVVLLGVAAFAVDLVHAYAEGQHLQNALDASALAGAVEIPNGNSAAADRACQLLKDNYKGQDVCISGEVNLTQNGIDRSAGNQWDVEGSVNVST